jgi:hypothetical protein
MSVRKRVMGEIIIKKLKKKIMIGIIIKVEINK